MLCVFLCHCDAWTLPLLLCLQVALSGDVPVGLHGGPLLGIAMKRMTSSGAELSGEEASPVLQFFSWNGVSKVGRGRGSARAHELWQDVCAGTLSLACRTCTSVHLFQ